jgi:hypothetical protein
LGVAGRSDLLIGTLGKAFGVNGGYVVGARTLIDFLRETAPMYIYSNPITPAEAAAALAAVEILDGAEGARLIAHLREMTRRFRDGLVALGLETLRGEHPVVPLLVRDTPRTVALVAHLRARGILATGLSFPVVPKGDETIRFQSGDHTSATSTSCSTPGAPFGEPGESFSRCTYRSPERDPDRPGDSHADSTCVPISGGHKGRGRVRPRAKRWGHQPSSRSKATTWSGHTAFASWRPTSSPRATSPWRSSAAGWDGPIITPVSCARSSSRSSTW